MMCLCRKGCLGEGDYGVTAAVWVYQSTRQECLAEGDYACGWEQETLFEADQGSCLGHQPADGQACPWSI